MESIGNPRKVRNMEVIARVKAGESIALYNPQDTGFPPRPIIKKDKNAFAFLPKKMKVIK